MNAQECNSTMYEYNIYAGRVSEIERRDGGLDGQRNNKKSSIIIIYASIHYLGW